MFWVYILASRSRVLYVGVTNDLPRRVLQHREGCSAFTSKYRIHRLVYCEEAISSLDAIARETQLKGWLRWKKVELIERHNPSWDDLASSWFPCTDHSGPSQILP